MAHLNRRQVLATTAAVLAAVTQRPREVVANPAEHIVRIRAFKFAPDPLQVKAGDRVTWINQDIVPHTATALDGSWDTGTIAKGGTQTLTVAAGMSGDYFCRFHPMMKAQIDVAPDA